MSKSNKQYLGDAVYVEFDGYQIKLTVSDGVYDTDTIYLDLGVMKSLIEYYEKHGRENIKG